MPTKPNPIKLARQLREMADDLDAYHELEPKRPNQEIWNVLTFAILYAEAAPNDRESMGWRLRCAVRKYRESEGLATNN